MTIANRPPLTWGMAARTPGDSLYPSLWYGYVGGAVPAVVGITDHQDQGQHPIKPTSAFPYTFQWVDSPIGPAWNSSTTTNGAYLSWSGTSGGGNKFKVSPPCSVAFHIRSQLSASPVNRWIFKTDADTTGFPASGLSRGVSVYVDNIGDTGLMVSDGTTVVGSLVAFGGTLLSANVWHTLVWTTWANDANSETITATNCGLWMDGIDIAAIFALADNSGTQLCTHANTAASLVNASRPNIGLADDTDYGLVQLWDRALDGQEAALLSADPVAMWRRNDLLRQPTPMLQSRRRPVARI